MAPLESLVTSRASTTKTEVCCNDANQQDVLRSAKQQGTQKEGCQEGRKEMSIEYRGERFAGYNKPKRTPKHSTKSHAVLAKEGDKVRLIRFGQQGVQGSPPRKGESEADKQRRASFKARHAKNIAKGKMSAAYWSNSSKW